MYSKLMPLECIIEKVAHWENILHWSTFHICPFGLYTKFSLYREDFYIVDRFHGSAFYG
jgi:hypothetical protein